MIASTSELVIGKADLIIPRGTYSAVTGPCLYATFRDDGRCQYVGISARGLYRPLQGNHERVSGGDWDRLLVWHVSPDVDLEAFELEAIAALCPLDNTCPPSPLSIKKKKQPRPPRDYMTTADVAARLSVTRKFVVGEIQDERLDALKRTSKSGRTVYRIHYSDFRRYMQSTWRPTSNKRSIAAQEELKAYLLRTQGIQERQ